MDRRAFLHSLALASGAVLIGCSDPEVTSTTTSAVSHVTVPDPMQTAITRWRLDPYARGSYSYLSLENLPGDRQLLAAAVDDKLFFAGEAASVTNPATVHGALMSGRDAASAVAAIAAPEARIGIVGAGAAGIGAGPTGVRGCLWEARRGVRGVVVWEAIREIGSVDAFTPTGPQPGVRRRFGVPSRGHGRRGSGWLVDRRNHRAASIRLVPESRIRFLVWRSNAVPV